MERLDGSDVMDEFHGNFLCFFWGGWFQNGFSDGLNGGQWFNLMVFMMVLMMVSGLIMVVMISMLVFVSICQYMLAFVSI